MMPGTLDQLGQRPRQELTACLSVRVGADRGFTLPEILVVVGVIGLTFAISAPSVSSAIRQYRLNSATREVAAEIRAARLRAVTTRRAMRVRFNCPAAGQFRTVEVVGDAAIDNKPDRCSSNSYPFPDLDPNARPNSDGPVLLLPESMQFGTIQDLQIAPTGTVTPLAGGMPATIQVGNGTINQAVTVTAAGRVQTPY